MPAYGSLALVKRDWADTVLPASAPVPSSSQSKKQTHSLQWVLLGEDLGISPTCEVGCRQFDSQKEQFRKGLKWFLDTCSWFPQHILSALEQSWLHNIQLCSHAWFARAVGKIRLLWKTSPFGLVDAIPFDGHSHRGKLLSRDYNFEWIWIFVIHLTIWKGSLSLPPNHCLLNAWRN